MLSVLSRHMKYTGVVATVEHGVPLMRSKWAHQEGEQGKGTRLADGPPSAPRGPDARDIDNQGKGPGDPPGPPRPGSRHGGPGTPTPGRRPGSPLGTNLQCAKRISLPALAGGS